LRRLGLRGGQEIVHPGFNKGALEKKKKAQAKKFAARNFDMGARTS